MPKLNEAEIKVAIARGDAFAITFDTQVFDAKQKNFRNPVLRRLNQFKARGVRVLIADVVASEMKAHFRKAAVDSQRRLKKALREHAHVWRVQGTEPIQNSFSLIPMRRTSPNRNSKNF